MESIDARPQLEPFTMGKELVTKSKVVSADGRRSSSTANGQDKSHGSYDEPQQNSANVNDVADKGNGDDGDGSDKKGDGNGSGGDDDDN